jgi:hypothetical protein
MPDDCDDAMTDRCAATTNKPFAKGNQMKSLKWQTVRNAGLILLGFALVAGCAPNVPLQAQKTLEQSANLPDAYYLQAEAQGKKILRVNAEKSLVVFEVRRAGAFARFGHDHVVASHEVKGFVAADEGKADLSVQLDKLVIDEPALRAEAGFTTQPTADDIAGTRRNMLNKVLDADRFPYALMQITRKGSESNLNVSITLHGMTRTFDVPASIETKEDGMIVSGKMTFNQSDFGIVPFSILNGAIQVQDRLDMRFHIVAETKRG